MLHTLTICASLGFGIFLSPELLIIGLILASDRSHPKANTLGYFLGSALGIVLLLILGYFLTHQAATPSHPTGAAWWLRVILGAGLIALGARTAWNQLHPKPKPSGHGGSHLMAKLMKLLPVSEAPRPGGPLPSLGICTALSFLLTVVHLKTIGLAMSAGHQLHTTTDQAATLAGLGGFLALSLFPTFLPLGLAVFQPETAIRARQVTEAVAAKHGGWILALIFLLIGLDFLHGALG